MTTTGSVPGAERGAPSRRLFADAIASHGLAIAAFLVLVVGTAAASYVIPMVFATKVPSVVGKTLAEAARALSDAQLSAVPSPGPAASAAAAATVIGTDPVASTRIGRGRPVKLSFTLPDVGNRTLETARHELRAIGLDPQPTGTPAATSLVTGTQPAAGSPVSQGSRVTLITAPPAALAAAAPAAPTLGAIPALTVPDVRGETLGAAIASLRDRGLTPVPAEATARIAAARVRTTVPPANASVAQKNPVVIWVEVPDGPDAGQILLDLGARAALDPIDGVWVERSPWSGPAPLLLEIRPTGSRASLAGQIGKLQTRVGGGRIAWVLSRPLSEACPEASRLAGHQYDSTPLETTFAVTLAPGPTPLLTAIGTTDWKVPCKDHPRGVERSTWRLGPQGS